MLKQKDAIHTIRSRSIIDFNHISIVRISSDIVRDKHYSITGKNFFVEFSVTLSNDQWRSKKCFLFSRQPIIAFNSEWSPNFFIENEKLHTISKIQLDVFRFQKMAGDILPKSDRHYLIDSVFPPFLDYIFLKNRWFTIF